MLLLISFGGYAQLGGVTGRILSREGRAPIEGVSATLLSATPLQSKIKSEKSDDKGVFTIENVDSAEYRLQLSAPDFETMEVVVRANGEDMIDLYTFVMIPSVQRRVVDDGAFMEYELENVNDWMSMPSTISSSKDLFSRTASYEFSEMRFSQRGYDSKYSDIYFNGIKMNDALTGYSPWSLWSGLNEATRNQETTVGSQSFDHGVGSLGSSTNIFARASHLRQGWTTSLVSADATYRFRAMVTYASGMQDNGWAYAFSFSTRQGASAYIDGVYYNTYGYFASVEKELGDQHLLSFTFLGTPTQRGVQGASTQEAYDLLDNNYYNPNWGYQDGELRNTRVREYHEPIAMLNYNFEIDDRTELNAATSFRFGQNGYSALTWFSGRDPRPDYYRYLPSYDRCPNPADLAEAWANNTDNISQIDFDALYNVNYNGAENSTYGDGVRSNYMIEERHTDQRDFNLALNINHYFKDNSKIIAGLDARRNRTEYYSTVKDLLGGDYWVDIDKFAERDFASSELAYQNNVAYYEANGHAQAVTEGDKYSYDYYGNVVKGDIWATYTIVPRSLLNLTASVSGELGYTSMWRDGLWQKGLYMDNSYGESEKLNYLTYKTKLNLEYNFNKIFSLYANGVVMSDAPTFQSAFVSPRTRNSVTPGIDTEKTMSVDATFNVKSEYVEFSLSGYLTSVKDQTKVISFYNDLLSSYDNFAMSGIDKKYMGIEAAVSVPIIAGISFNSTLSLGEYLYNSNPTYIEMADNSSEAVSQGTVFWDGYRVESTPQTALNVELSYFGSNYLFASLGVNFYDNNYLSMNPLYRTDDVLTAQMIADGSAEVLRAQEKFDSAYTLNASIGKSWYINRVYNLGVNLQVKNLLNFQDIKTGGYEQMRLNDVTNDAGDVVGYTRFDSKYFYMLGRTYYLNVYLRF